ncbi:MAG: hypothetical protein K0S93_506 [Nitrososphaeraceae archaeon]|jgi:hypothetical protein|nr:hypothetical protein [Nitrososphaeraceae archaeon]
MRRQTKWQKMTLQLHLNLREQIQQYLEETTDSPYTASYEILTMIRDRITNFMNEDLSTD